MNLISILSDTVNRFGYKGNKFVIRPLINYILKHTLLSSSRKNFSEEIAAILKFYTSYANIYSYDRVSCLQLTPGTFGAWRGVSVLHNPTTPKDVVG